MGARKAGKLAAMSSEHEGPLDAVIIGAGVAGLTCARDLAARGWRVVVIEKSRGVGGRCATRRMLGQSVDIGLTYFHSDDEALLAELAAVPATRLPGWPLRVTGSGAPCHPASLRAGQQRMAFAEGVNVFPKHLARGLTLRFSARVTGIDARDGHAEVRFEDEAPLRARHVVLAVPARQAQALLEDELGQGLPGVVSPFAQVVTAPCITLCLGYPATAPLPEFDVHYPEDSEVIQLISHDSVKRVDPDYRVLVVQAEPAWSELHLEDEAESWRRTLTQEAARLVGGWVGAPEWTDVQRWRFAKLVTSTTMAAPRVFDLPGGARLGLTGEAFAREAGVQGAYRAGRALARDLLADPTARGG